MVLTLTLTLTLSLSVCLSLTLSRFRHLFRLWSPTQRSEEASGDEHEDEDRDCKRKI